MDTIEEPRDSFQSRLRTAMKMRNMSVNTLSKKSGISSHTIYIYLNPEKYHRESCPGSNNLEALAVALDVSMDWLWGRPVALMSWIPVSERLPEDLAEVITTWVNRDPLPYYEFMRDKPFTAVSVHYKGEWYWYSSTCADYLEEYGRSDRDKVDKSIEIIAWMPLPTPYGKETT